MLLLFCEDIEPIYLILILLVVFFFSRTSKIVNISFPGEEEIASPSLST